MPSPAHDEQSLGPATPTGPLAAELSQRLDCAVLAMRYSVEDDFFIELTKKLYDLIADKAQPLPHAVAPTLRELSRAGQFSALSVAAPALFGANAATLQLGAPPRNGPGDSGTRQPKLSGFPPQPDRFVGRTALMARASEALAVESGIPGVLLHGMPGGGKTACALELAYTHDHAFDQFVWYKAPDEGTEIAGALTDFALTLENALPGFQMAHLVFDTDNLTPFLPKLTELMEHRRLLLVIDNTESLLSESGEWLDDRWGLVIDALTTHGGLGRLILTTRRVPAALTRLRVGSVGALLPDETLLLVRDLHYLQSLAQGRIAGIDRMDTRRLARRVLEIAQGHPKLLEIANGQASDSGRLTGLIEAGDTAWRAQGVLPGGFFNSGESTSDTDYLGVLAAWTKLAMDALAPGERDIFWFLCCLEESDRGRPALETIWPRLWQRLERHGQLPDLDSSLTTITSYGLTAVQENPGGAERYIIHPGVAAVARDHAEKPFRDAVDKEASAYWYTVCRIASGDTEDGRSNIGLLMRSSLATIPYEMRQDDWNGAATMLEYAFLRDPSRTNAAKVLPLIQRIIDNSPGQADVLHRVLAATDPAKAEVLMRRYVDAAAARGEYRAASAVAARLCNMSHAKGKLDEALSFAERSIEYTREAKLGPWSQLASQVQRLQVLNAMGHARTVFTEARDLLGQMMSLPTALDPNGTMSSAEVMEALFGTGRDAARALGQWEFALDLNKALIGSKLGRHATLPSIAQAMYNDYGPLLQLGRTDKALAVLQECLKIFRDAKDLKGTGLALSALASIEKSLGREEAAIRLERDALRYKYLSGDIIAIADSYQNLGVALRSTQQGNAALACHLASALIRALTGIDGANRSVRSAATDLREIRFDVIPVQYIADLSSSIGDIPGTDLTGLIGRLSPTRDAADQALHYIIAKAQEFATATSDEH